MNKAQIKEHLDLVMGAFLTLFPRPMWPEVEKSVYFAGGCVVNLVRDEPVLDYDMFIKTEEARDSIRKYFEEIQGQEVGFNILALTPNAVTLGIGPYIVQVVTRFTGTTERVFKTFDYEHCKSFYDPAEDQLVYPEEIILKKQLIYSGEKDEFTLNTLKRMAKFVSRGWLPDNESIINLHRAIQNRPHIDGPEERKLQTIGFYGSSFT